MKDFFPIETTYDSEDYKLMKNVVNKGIDSNLEAFTKSKFMKSPNFNNKFLFDIHKSELPILYRRLQELADETGNDDYESLLNDIQRVADVGLNAMAGHGDEELDEMIDPYDPMDANQTINGFPTNTSDLAVDGVDTAPAYKQGANAFKNQSIEDYIDDDTIPQEMTAENSSDSLANQHGMNAKPETIEEDSIMKRKLAGQRGKTVPLGQHAPHSQAAKK